MVTFSAEQIVHKLMNAVGIESWVTTQKRNKMEVGRARCEDEQRSLGCEVTVLDA